MTMYSYCYVYIWLPWLRFIRVFSSVVRQMPGQNPQRRGTARNLPNFCVVLCIVCVYMCTELLPTGDYQIAVKYIIYHIISYHHIIYHTISYHIIISYHISYHTISYHITSYIIPYHIISYIIPYHTISCHIVSYHIISYIIPYHTISYHIIPYHIISYHIISYHIISYKKFFFNFSHFSSNFENTCPRKVYEYVYWLTVRVVEVCLVKGAVCWGL